MFNERLNLKATNLTNKIKQLRYAIDSAEAIVIGAGAGLSTSAGFTYSGERFDKYFSNFRERYGFSDMYTGGFYPYKTLEEHWAYWSRFVYINRYMDVPKPVYSDLLNLVKDKDYFVITTNVDHCFQKAGIDKKRLFYTQGDYGLFQCSEPCCNETFENKDIIIDMIEYQNDMKIPSELIPKCPHCGRPLTMNLRCDDKFIEDEGWHKASERYSLFLRRHKNMNTLFLELGAGYNTPSIIKFSFWQKVNQWDNAIYACVNLNEAYAPIEIKYKSICIDGDIGNVLNRLKY